MERKNLNQVSIHVRDSYNRVAKSSASVDVDSAIGLLKDLVKQNPELGPARDRLRELERRKAAMQGAFSRTWAQFCSLFKLPIIRGRMLKNPVGAMGMCEDSLAKALDNPPVLTALADAAEAAEAPFIASEALSIIHEFHPKNEANSRRLAYALQASNQAREGLKILQEVAAKYPGDLGMQAELRSAMALASMERGKWEEEGSSQQKASDTKAAVAQQLIEGTIHDAAQAQVLIDKFTKDLADNDSVDIRRKLADAYLVAEDYESAIREMKLVAKKLGALDPTLDKAIEKAYIAQLNQAIGELQAHPEAYENAEEQIVQLTEERESYRMRHAKQRVKTYPNDALLRFDLGEILFERNDFEGALTEFQQAMRSPQKRTECLLKLGQCFARKGQFDIAVEQFESAMKDMMRGSDQRLETLYFLGNTYEEAGNMEKAMDCYKEIYQGKANYRDVAQRIDAYYSKK